MRVTPSECTPSECPRCHAMLDRAMYPFGKQTPPAPGDATVCMYCCVVLVFTHKLTLRTPKYEEMKEFSRDPRIRRLRDAIMSLNSMFN